MRASTLFGLTIAILIGMAVVFGVKSAGLFSAKIPPVNPQLPSILVAQSNLFEGHALSANDVMVRPIDPSEREHYENNKRKYMPAFPGAVNFRVLSRHVYANEPLLKEHFKDMGIPDSFSNGLLRPGYKAVNLQVLREDAGGGVIRKNDYVDLLLTTTICTDPNCTNPKSATAPLALGLKVIVKQDSIFTRMQALPEDKPMSFTIEANPYRAALIEFAKRRGRITLVPTGPPSSKGDKLGPNAVTDGKDEERRIIRFQEGNSINDRDLEEIFRLGSIPLPPGPIVVERLRGLYPDRAHVFPGQGQGDNRSGYEYTFQAPDSYVPCPTCPGGKRKVVN
ncbi:MAG: RcpC/CpaB family pilus assembly protein [Planctomycetota bacterium]